MLCSNLSVVEMLALTQALILGIAQINQSVTRVVGFNGQLVKFDDTNSNRSKWSWLVVKLTCSTLAALYLRIRSIPKVRLVSNEVSVIFPVGNSYSRWSVLYGLLSTLPNCDGVQVITWVWCLYGMWQVHYEFWVLHYTLLPRKLLMKLRVLCIL